MIRNLIIGAVTVITFGLMLPMISTIIGDTWGLYDTRGQFALALVIPVFAIAIIVGIAINARGGRPTPTF